MTLTLDEKTIGMYRSLVCEPKQHGLTYPAFKDCFRVVEKTTASHILYRDYLLCIESRPLPKVIFYILMYETFGNPNGKDEHGSLGYKLTSVGKV